MMFKNPEPSVSLESLRLLTLGAVNKWLDFQTQPEAYDVTEEESYSLPEDYLTDYNQLRQQALLWATLNKYEWPVLCATALAWLVAMFTLAWVELSQEVTVVLVAALSFVAARVAVPFLVVFNPKYAFNKAVWNLLSEYLTAVDKFGLSINNQADLRTHNKAILRAVDFGYSTGIIASAETKNPSKGKTSVSKS